MPYITPSDRSRYDSALSAVPPARSKGELNYLISKLFKAYIDANGTSYATLSDCTGAGTDAVEEFRRRIMNPYEDTKIASNGDIYQ